MWQDTKLLNATANVLFGLAAMLLLLAGVWLLINRPMFTLNAIQVEGANSAVLKHVNPQIIRSTALDRIKGNFFTTNLDSIRRAFEMVPWVRKASVRREWPDRLIVTLEEHVPLGTWGEDGQILSVHGEVFTANLAEVEEESKLLEFSGPAGSEKEVLAHYLTFCDWFKKIDLAPQTVDYSKRYAWQVTLDNGLTVELGREDNGRVLQERLNRLVEVYPELVSRLGKNIESVDLRYPNGLALRTKQEMNPAAKQNGQQKKQS
jgi:cell division protein FtsQ